jgi:hypothetical protein
MVLVQMIWSGLVATTLALAFFWIASSLRWTAFSPAVQVGSLIIPDPRKPITETVGFLLLLVLGTTLLPLLFAWLLGFWGGAAWLGGLVIGGFGGIAVAVSLSLIGTRSALVRSGAFPLPGPLGIGWGRPTPAVILAGGMIYGILVAAVLAGF